MPWQVDGAYDLPLLVDYLHVSAGKVCGQVDVQLMAYRVWIYLQLIAGNGCGLRLTDMNQAIIAKAVGFYEENAL